MNEPSGLGLYLENHYADSVFDLALDDTSPWVYHLHGHQIVQARLTHQTPYDVSLAVDGKPEREIAKTEIKLVYPGAHAAAAGKLIKVDKKVLKRNLGPIVSPKYRYHIKNKTLFPLMNDRQVLFFTLLEGEIVRGLVTAFSRYDLTVSLKGGIPVTILRHSILDVRDKRGHCYLKPSRYPTP